MAYRFKPSAVLVGLTLLLSTSAHSQSPPAAPIPQGAPLVTLAPVTNSAEGLKNLFENIVAESKAGDTDGVASFAKEMQIPNFEEWFIATFGAENGKPWAAAYGATLDGTGKRFHELVLRLSPTFGEIVTRKVNHAPDPAFGLEREMLDSLTHPVEIYFAAWKGPGLSADSHGAPIGYFIFVDGMFRWDSGVVLADLRLAPPPSSPVQPNPSSDSSVGPPVTAGSLGPFLPGLLGVGFPSCLVCHNPPFTDEARAAHTQGTVLVYATVQTNGQLTNITLVRGIGSGLDENTIAALKNWIL